MAGYVARHSTPLTADADLDPLLDLVGDAACVMIGEATHGTREFYQWRARLSRRLIVERGFRFIGVEGDWPDCYRLSRYVQGLPQSGVSAHHVLHAFDRWPTWMWANQEVVDFAEWLRGHNLMQPADKAVGIYGLDVYSLWDSMRAVADYLEAVDPAAVDQAKRAFRCFEPYGGDAQAYARTVMMVPQGCTKEVVDLLVHLNGHAREYTALGNEAYFNAGQNALIARNAEHYYRTMVQGGAASWNVRDGHMMATLERLRVHHGPKSKAIVWAHNTHVGDARATDMAAAGMVSIGQLARERYGADEVVLIGFLTHRGQVIASHSWETPWYQLPVPMAAAGSWEQIFHLARPEDQVLVLSPDVAIPPMRTVRGHRAIGVVYQPRYERFDNYVPTDLAARYDAVIHVDHSHALSPLHVPERLQLEPPDTFPWAV
ncbi:MAG: erythromycin esterase family protein [Candidatus Sericytochromatia bacterium]|nr:erythromycin esterase family protein [Candidatus Sericytochromatia bacterium]